MKKILITGAAGYLGSSIYDKFKKDYDVFPLTRSICDLTNHQQVFNFLQEKYFDIVIHCAVQGGNRLKPEDNSVMDTNLIMYYNILNNKNRFDKFIHIGSGAEFNSNLSPYGLSKKVISKSMSEKLNFFDLKIFAVFDENENDRRFIKTALVNYINKKPIVIHDNKKMDFFYLADFLTILEKYFDNNTLPKNLNCVYEKKISLLEIATFINNLDSYKVPIQIENNFGVQDYIGNFNPIVSNFDLYGLENGISNVYCKILKKNKND